MNPDGRVARCARDLLGAEQAVVRVGDHRLGEQRLERPAELGVGGPAPPGEVDLQVPQEDLAGDLVVGEGTGEG